MDRNMPHRRMQKAKFGTFGKSKLWKFECVQNSVVLSQADLVSMKDMERFHENTLLDQILIFLLAKFIIGAKLTCWKLFHGNGNSAGTFFKSWVDVKITISRNSPLRGFFMISRKKSHLWKDCRLTKFSLTCSCICFWVRPLYLMGERMAVSFGIFI